MILGDYGMISKSIAVLDAALRVYLGEWMVLSESEPNSFHYERIELGAGLIVFRLKYALKDIQVFGSDTAEFRLRALDSDRTAMTISEPRRFLKTMHDETVQYLLFRLIQDDLLPRSQPEKIGQGKAEKPAAKRVGRPRNPDDEWAWKQVNVEKRNRTAVEKEWLVRIGERANILADPHDSFNKAVAKKRRN